MPEFDLDAALEAQVELLACQHCGGRCTFVDWEEDPESDWRAMIITGNCRDCQRKTWFKYVYTEDKRMLDGETRVSEQDYIMASCCPFCENPVDAWDLRAAVGHRLCLLDHGPVTLTDFIYFQADCPDCAMVRNYYRFDSVEPMSADDWDAVEPDVDRRVLAPEGEVPEGD